MGAGKTCSAKKEMANAPPKIRSGPPGPVEEEHVSGSPRGRGDADPNRHLRELWPVAHVENRIGTGAGRAIIYCLWGGRGHPPQGIFPDHHRR